MKIKTLFLTLMICGACYCSAAETPAAAPNNAPATEAVAPAKKPQQQSSWKSMIVPIGIIVVMILLFSRANKKQQKQRQEMMNKIVKGTKVLLNSGVYGKVIEVKENIANLALNSFLPCVAVVIIIEAAFLFELFLQFFFSFLFVVGI